MRIVNHKISMQRGETPNYSATIRTSNGAPYIIDDNKDYCFEFVVRPTLNSRGDVFLFRRYVPLDVHVFDAKTIIDYEGDVDWNNDIPPEVGFENFLHRLSLGGEYQYRYYDAGTWVDYKLVLSIDFPYIETKEFESKTYYYEINLLGGTFLNPLPEKNTECPLEIVKKISILTPKEFRVEGSIGV